MIQAQSGTLAKYIKENISGGVDLIMTDEWPAYKGALTQAGFDRGITQDCLPSRRASTLTAILRRTALNPAFSLLKRGIIGSWHKVSAKHLTAYLDEMTFRFNNRSNPFLFRDTLIKLIEAPVLEYKKLIDAAA